MRSALVSMQITLPLLCVFLFATYALASNCTDACDVLYAGQGELITFCSSNDETFTAYQVSLHPVRKIFSSCYAQCGVGIKHVGVCGCPNGCYNDLGRGNCDTKKQKCSCKSGWSGKDCSVIKCPNACSRHGDCDSQDSDDGGDICKCDEGWTAYDCSVAIPTSVAYGTLPYGEIDEGGHYYADDSYGDLHPFFDTSRVATVKIWVSDENEKYLLDPLNTFQQEYVPAKLYFYNGIISKYADVTFRLKGSSTRLNPKKSWNVIFDKNKSWNGLKGFGIKSNIADRVVTAHLVLEFYRALKVQTLRTSIAEFFFNDRYYGVERLEEFWDENLIKSRWDVEDTNMYKMGPYSMEYLGEDPQAYKSFNFTLFDSLPTYGISQEVGNGDYSDFVELVSAINQSTPTATAYLKDNFDIKVFLRAMALETIIKNGDAYLSTGNNYLLTDTKEKDEGKKRSDDEHKHYWVYSASDFDVSMIPLEDSFAPVLGMTGDQLRALMASGVTTFLGIDLTQHILSSNPYDLVSRPTKPLSYAVFAIDGSNKTFTKYILSFIDQVILSTPGTTQNRREAYYQLTRSLVARDRMYSIMPTTASLTGKGLETFDAAQITTKEWIDERWGYLVSMFVAKGNGQCNSLGQCTCNDGYFGSTCDDYCGVSFEQERTNAGMSGTDEWSTYKVTVIVGSSPLHDNAVIQAIAPSPSASLSDVDYLKKVKGSTDLYSFPDDKFDDDKISANSNSLQFGYTINSAQPATFRLNNNACKD